MNNTPGVAAASLRLNCLHWRTVFGQLAWKGGRTEKSHKIDHGCDLATGFRVLQQKFQKHDVYI